MKGKLTELLGDLESLRNTGDIKTEIDRARDPGDNTTESDLVKKIKRTLEILSKILQKDYPAPQYKSVSRWLWSEFKVAIDAFEDLDLLIKRKKTLQMLQSEGHFFFDETMRIFCEDIFLQKKASLETILDREQTGPDRCRGLLRGFASPAVLCYKEPAPASKAP